MNKEAKVEPDFESIFSTSRLSSVLYDAMKIDCDGDSDVGNISNLDDGFNEGA